MSDKREFWLGLALLYLIVAALLALAVVLAYAVNPVWPVFLTPFAFLAGAVWQWWRS